ncbi:hypothetical protein IP87_17325 [beta proteobacterium AAP121]|nr:hypothetical protein IP80_19635 [beta proteobacterium AAP65]KPF95164.1 hypothetical protein IP87_17325 [beta proteobacterium AAP121]
MVGHALKIVAAAAPGFVALLLAGITVSAISSGVEGMMVILVGATGWGAVVLGLIAAWLLSNSGPGCDSVRSPIRRRHRNGQNVHARPAI